VSETSDRSVLEAARQQAGLSEWDLWLRYFALGGSATRADVEWPTLNGGVLDDGQYDILVHALNERFADVDFGHPLPYVSNLQP
jgi:hypothetical protein